MYSEQFIAIFIFILKDKERREAVRLNFYSLIKKQGDLNGDFKMRKSLAPHFKRAAPEEG